MPDSPEYPGIPGSPQPPAGAPPFQTVQPAYQPVPTPGYAPGPASGYGGGGTPPPPPAKGGSSALKIILIILGVLVVLVMLVVGVIGYIGYRIAHSVHTDKNGAVSVNVPGFISSDSNVSFTADELGTEIYPGATPARNGNMKMTIAGNTVSTAKFITKDSKDKVIAFYKDKLGDQATAMDLGSIAMLSLKKTPKDLVQVNVSPQGDHTQISISHTISKSE